MNDCFSQMKLSSKPPDFVWDANETALMGKRIELMFSSLHSSKLSLSKRTEILNSWSLREVLRRYVISAQSSDAMRVVQRWNDELDAVQALSGADNLETNFYRGICKCFIARLEWRQGHLVDAERDYKVAINDLETLVNRVVPGRMPRITYLRKSKDHSPLPLVPFLLDSRAMAYLTNARLGFGSVLCELGRYADAEEQGISASKTANETILFSSAATHKLIVDLMEGYASSGNITAARRMLDMVKLQEQTCSQGRIYEHEDPVAGHVESELKILDRCVAFMMQHPHPSDDSKLKSFAAYQRSEMSFHRPG